MYWLSNYTYIGGNEFEEITEKSKVNPEKVNWRNYSIGVLRYVIENNQIIEILPNSKAVRF